MTGLDAQQLEDLLGPVRDLHVALLLETMAQELGRGAEVDAEPVARDAEGRIRRTAPFGLPRRHDLRVAHGAGVAMRQVDGRRALRFAPVTVRIGPAGAARIAPFDWGAAEIRVRGAVTSPDWTPLRHWFLEWFQPRYGDESPDLLGAVHALDGPRETDGDRRFTVDLGSSPVASFVAMAAAFGQAGFTDIRIGATEDALRRRGP